MCALSCNRGRMGRTLVHFENIRVKCWIPRNFQFFTRCTRNRPRILCTGGKMHPPKMVYYVATATTCCESPQLDMNMCCVLQFRRFNTFENWEYSTVHRYGHPLNRPEIVNFVRTFSGSKWFEPEFGLGNEFAPKIYCFCRFRWANIPFGPAFNNRLWWAWPIRRSVGINPEFRPNPFGIHWRVF